MIIQKCECKKTGCDRYEILPHTASYSKLQLIELVSVIDEYLQFLQDSDLEDEVTSNEQKIEENDDTDISRGKNETEKMERRFNVWLENRDDDFEMDIWQFRCLQDFIFKEIERVIQLKVKEDIASPVEQYKCPSYVEDGKVINCKCGKCFYAKKFLEENFSEKKD